MHNHKLQKNFLFSLCQTNVQKWLRWKTRLSLNCPCWTAMCRKNSAHLRVQLRDVVVEQLRTWYQTSTMNSKDTYSVKIKKKIFCSPVVLLVILLAKWYGPAKKPRYFLDSAIKKYRHLKFNSFYFRVDACVRWKRELTFIGDFRHLCKFINFKFCEISIWVPKVPLMGR